MALLLLLILSAGVKSGLFGTLFTLRLVSITSMNVTHNHLCASVRAQ